MTDTVNEGRQPTMKNPGGVTLQVCEHCGVEYGLPDRPAPHGAEECRHFLKLQNSTFKTALEEIAKIGPNDFALLGVRALQQAAHTARRALGLMK